MKWLVACLIYSILICKIASSSSIDDAENIINITFGNTIVWLYSSSIIRVTHLSPKIYNEPSLNSIIVHYNGPISPIQYNESTSNNMTTIMTDYIEIKVDHNNANTVSFIKKSNSEYLLSESENMFILHNDSVLNFATYTVSQQWIFYNEYTSIYGWGQYQNGFINYRDTTVRCIQYNTEICIPFLVTTNHHGILWDNTGLTHLNIRNQIQFNEWSNITVANNGCSKNLSAELQCDNNIHFDTSSGYHFYIDFSENNPFEFGAHSTSYWAIYINDEIYDYWTKGFNPSTISTKAFSCNKGEILNILFVFDDLKTPNNIQNHIYYNKPSMSFDIESYESPYIDYYFIYGANMDDIIGNYRVLSGGAVPMYSLNIFGFWQCKNTYNNESAILESATEFRIRGLPVDNIVQDINYWGDLGQGPHFDPVLFPNAKRMVDELHAMNFHVMITVHPDFAINTEFYSNMMKQKYLIPNTSFTDFYNENAAKQMYQFINDSMYTINVDYIWLDSTEPTKMFNINNTLKYVDTQHNIDTIISGNYYLNSYSLFDAKWMYTLYNNDVSQSNKRYFTLTRSQFAGQHIYGSTVWSGDINSNWDQFKRQISAGINYMISGNPYWTNDIGGFWRNGVMQYNDTAYQYQLIRWFQFGVFLPIFRVHGFHSNTEYWNYGAYVEESILLMDNLRYRLLPYIYTINYLIYKHHYTMTRALIFDFCCNDYNIFNIFEQFMFGPYMLVSIIVDYENTTNIYLPGVNDANKYRFWYNFWNATKYHSGQWLKHYDSAPNIVPIHIHSGSILILGPFVQYSSEIPWTELEIRIYAGNDANFTLFEDDGFERNSVENNHYTLITFVWNDDDQILSISNRYGGTFHNMQRERLFNLVMVDINHGVGVNVTENVDKSVKYNGKEMQIRL